MSQPDRPLGSELREEIARLAADVRRMAALRWELARRETAADLRAARRLGLAAVVAAVMALAVLPLLAVALACWLDGWLGVPMVAWLLVWAAALLAAATAVGLLAWRRFRREFSGLSGTLEELREDLVWLQDWAERLGGKDEG